MAKTPVRTVKALCGATAQLLQVKHLLRALKQVLQEAQGVVHTGTFIVVVISAVIGLESSPCRSRAAQLDTVSGSMPSEKHVSSPAGQCSSRGSR